MPIYEYGCEKCGHQMEIMQKFSDPPIEECEACRGKMKKLISQSTFHLKGSGWYVTDYASNRTNASSCAEKDESGSTPEKPSTKAEAKDSSENSSQGASNTSD